MPTYEEYVDQHGPELLKYMGPYILSHSEYIDSHENAKLIIDYFRTNNLPITEANVAMAVAAHEKAGWKVNLTKEEQALDAARTSLGTSYELFAKWFSYQHIEKTPRAEIAIINECRGHQVTKESLDQFLGRAASKGLITFVKAPDHVGYVPGQYSGKDLRDEVKPEEMTDALGNRLNRTARDVRGEAGKQYIAKLEREREEQSRPSTHDESYWIERAEKACGANLASTQGELRRMVITKPGTSVIDWEATARSREQMQQNIGSR